MFSVTRLPIWLKRDFYVCVVSNRKFRADYETTLPPADGSTQHGRAPQESLSPKCAFNGNGFKKKEGNIKTTSAKIGRKTIKTDNCAQTPLDGFNFGLFCNIETTKCLYFNLDSFSDDSWPKDFTYFRKKLFTKSGSSSISGCPQRSRDLDNSPLNPPALRDDSTIDVLQPLTLSQLSGRETSRIEGNYMFSPVWKSSTVSVLPLSDTWTAEERHWIPPCVSNRGDLLSPSQRLHWNAACWNVTGSRKTRPEDWKQKQLREMTNLYEGGLFYL